MLLVSLLFLSPPGLELRHTCSDDGVLVFTTLLNSQAMLFESKCFSLLQKILIPPELPRFIRSWSLEITQHPPIAGFASDQVIVDSVGPVFVLRLRMVYAAIRLHCKLVVAPVS